MAKAQSQPQIANKEGQEAADDIYDEVMWVNEIDHMIFRQLFIYLIKR